MERSGVRVARVVRRGDSGMGIQRGSLMNGLAVETIHVWGLMGIKDSETQLILSSWIRISRHTEMY